MASGVVAELGVVASADEAAPEPSPLRSAARRAAVDIVIFCRRLSRVRVAWGADSLTGTLMMTMPSLLAFYQRGMAEGSGTKTQASAVLLRLIAGPTGGLVYI